MTAALVDALERRVRSDGSQPLVTWYDLPTGDRTELSARTFANWVDKTVNLMASMGADDQPAVALPLLLSHPGHWVGLVWAMATWQAGGLVVALPREELKLVDLAVIGPDNVHPVPGAETVACSLHPMGLAFAAPPVAVTDFAEVLSQPDVHWTSVMPGQGLAYRGPGGERRTASEVDQLAPDSVRRLVHAVPGADPWVVLRDCLVSPVLGGGSVVVASGAAAPGQLEELARSEQAGLAAS